MPTTVTSIRIDAPAELVWRALTEPALVKRWQFGSDLQTDWTPGSPIRFVSEWEGQVFEQWGTVEAVDAPRSLRYSLFAPRPGLDDVPEHYFVMTYSVEPGPSGTLVRIAKEDERPGAEPQPEGEPTPVLVALRAVAEELQAPPPS